MVKFDEDLNDINSKYQEDLDKASEFFNNNDFGKSLNIYLQLYKKEPNNLAILNNIISTYAKLGDYNQVIKFADIYLDMDNNNNNVLFSKVIGLINLKRYEEALEILNILIDNNPKDLNAYVFKYKILTILNMDDKKREFFRRLKNFDKRTFSRLIITLGFLKEQGDNITLRDFDNMSEAKIKAKTDEILDDFSYLYDDIINPFAEYRFNLFRDLLYNLNGNDEKLGEILKLFNDKNFDYALKKIDKLLEEDLNRLNSIENEDISDLESSDSSDISMTVEEEIEVSIDKDFITDNNEVLWIYKAILLFNLNDEKDALDIINHLLDVDRNSFEIWSVRAIIQSSLGNYNNASRSFKRALSINDENTDLWVLYIYSLLLNDNWDKALKENEKAREIISDDSQFNSSLDNLFDLNSS